MNNNINVLMVDPWSSNDYSLFLCSNLKQLGVNVTLVVNEDRNIISNGIEVIKMLPGKGKAESKKDKILKYIAYISSLYSLYKKNKYDFLHFQSFRRRRIETFYFYLLSLLKVRLIYTVHDIDPLDNSRVDRFLNKIIYNTADALLAHSETNKRLLKENYKIDGSKVSVIPHGSFENSFNDTGLSNPEARKHFGLNPDHNVLLFFGAVKEYKGIDLLIRAASRASETVQNLVLIIAGNAENKQLEDKYIQQIERTSSKLKIIYNFNFIDNKDVELYFKASDAVVLPYRIISHSGVLHLAYSFGKPVIASRTGDFEEFVNEGETGFLFNTNDENDLHTVLNKVFSSKEKLNQMGQCAKRINREKYSWELSAAKLKHIYEQLNTTEAF